MSRHAYISEETHTFDDEAMRRMRDTIAASPLPGPPAVTTWTTAPQGKGTGRRISRLLRYLRSRPHA